VVERLIGEAKSVQLSGLKLISDARVSTRTPKIKSGNGMHIRELPGGSRKNG
jgi:hypothetical protein